MNDHARVLIVDDSREVLDAIRRTLKRCEFDLTCVDCPKEAIELLRTKPFDLLISDIDMPVINGHEVMSHAQHLQPKMVRVFVTGAGSIDAAVLAINEGEVHRFVRKPFESGPFRKLLNEALMRKAELDVVSEASERVRHRQQLYLHLESEHPGITSVQSDESGYYRVDTATLRCPDLRLWHVPPVVR